MSSASKERRITNSISHSMDTILEFEHVSFSYEKRNRFINDLSFSIGNGEFIGLLGANGSGKSTILKLASGILKAAGGHIHLWNKSITLYKNKDRAKLLSYLPQLLHMNIPFTVRELIHMGLYPYEILPALTVEATLEMVGLSGKAGSRVIHLSGGEKRRAFIGMTLLQGAGLLLLDEPLANLDIKYQIEFLKLLRELQRERNITVVMALHDINIALQFDRLMLIKDGKVLGAGNPDTVLRKDLLKQAFDVEVEIRREASGGIYIKY